MLQCFHTAIIAGYVDQQYLEYGCFTETGLSIEETCDAVACA